MALLITYGGLYDLVPTLESGVPNPNETFFIFSLHVFVFRFSPWIAKGIDELIFVCFFLD